MTAMKSPPYNACCLGRWLFWLRSYAQAVPVTRPPSPTPCSSRARRGSWLAVKAPGLLTAREAGAAATAAAGGLIAELASHAQGFWRRGAGTAQPCRREQSTALCVGRLLCRRRVYSARYARRAPRPPSCDTVHPSRWQRQWHFSQWRVVCSLCTCPSRISKHCRDARSQLRGPGDRSCQRPDAARADSRKPANIDQDVACRQRVYAAAVVPCSVLEWPDLHLCAPASLVQALSSTAAAASAKMHALFEFVDFLLNLKVRNRTGSAGKQHLLHGLFP